MEILTILAQAIWFIWPAYTANAFPAVLNGKKPLDFGKKIGKNRVLGSSKTIEGTIGGILFGILIGVVQINLYDYLPKELSLVRFTLPMVVALSVGALLGDIAGSFIKRRGGMKPGQSAVFLDQLGFLIVSLIIVSYYITLPMETIVLLVVITPPIHLLTNILGFVLKFKKVPW